MIDWQQDIFDLMASKTIRLTVSGEMGEVQAELLVEQFNGSGWNFQLAASGVGDTFDEVMTQLMIDYQARQREAALAAAGGTEE